MSTVVFRRQARRPAPELPRGEVLLESPPELPESVSSGFGAAMTYLPMAAGAGAMALMFMGRGGGPLQMVTGGMFAVSMLGMLGPQLGRGAGEKKRKLNADRRDYARYLSQARRRVRRAARQQREALLWRNPDPDALWSVAMSSRLWERRTTDEDFGAVRVGLGSQRLAVQLVPPETKPVEDLEPVSAGALRRFVRAHSTVAELPVALSVKGFARVAFRGDEEVARGLIRAMLAHLAVFHSPEDLRIAVCASRERAPLWDWTKWLPHALHPTDADAAGPVRLFAESLIEIENMLGEDLTQRPRFGSGSSSAADPQYVVVVDGGRVGFDSQLATAGVHGVSVLDVSGSVSREAERGTLRLSITADQLDMLSRDRANNDVASRIGRPDRLSLAAAEALARQLAPYRMSTGGDPEDSLAKNLGLTQLLGLGDPYQIDPSLTWRPRAPRDRLRVPIGVGPVGEPVELDIKEAAQDGMGPHGLVIGATGSGKSELLRTLVLGLAVTHSSETLNFVLVDFKGGATFSRLDDLPHTSAVITNLADELSLVDRMKDAIEGELNRRQELLRDAGNYANLKDYEKDRENGAPLKPMPSLFVVVDEFSELLSAKPDFIDLFIAIGRIGRSLGVHLLLASQRLEEGRLRGLDTYLSYRVGLRTFSAIESRVVLGVPDAYELPNAPGHGYLKIDTSTMLRFKAAYVSGAYRGPKEGAGRGHVAALAQQIVPYSNYYLRPIDPPRVEEPEEKLDEAGAETLLDVIVQRLIGRGQPAHAVWLPPLAEPPTLDQLLPPLAVDPKFGLTPAGWEGRGRLQLPVGLVDKPYHQRRDPMWIDLSGAAGHVVVAGGPQSGKSTLVRDVIASMALTHTPEEVQFYCLDFGGGTLSSLLGLPHVGSVAGRLEPDLIRRTLAEMNGLLERREKRFTQARIDSMSTYRRMKRDGKITDDPYGDVFLVVDGWGVLRADFEALEPQITQLAARGLGYGIHVVVTIQRWMELRPALRDLIGTRLELRLGDPTESDVDRRTAVNVPEKSPGRGLSRDKLHFMSALPRVDGDQRPDTLIDGVADLAARVSEAWRGPRAPIVRMLPAELPYADLPAAGLDPHPGLPIGIDEDNLAPVYLEFGTDAHFMAFGDTQCGKTNLLRVIAAGITSRYTSDQAKIIFLDYRYGLLDAVSTPHKIAHGFSSNHAAPIVKNVLEAMTKRLPPPDITPDRLKARDWWTGADLYFVIDDYDLVSTGASNPLMPLLELLPQARDIGLHLVVARAMGGAGRAMFEPVIQRLKEIGTPTLIMSGNRDEGNLAGTVKPEPLPPGRGRLVTRRGAKLIQAAFLPPVG